MQELTCHCVLQTKNAKCEMLPPQLCSASKSKQLYFLILYFQLSSKRETCGDKSRQLRDAQQDARDKVEVKKSILQNIYHYLGLVIGKNEHRNYCHSIMSKLHYV